MSCILRVLLVVLFCVSLAVADSVGPITFSSDADYTNANPNTGGLFRDVLNGARVSRGLDLGLTGHTALNFTGSDNNSPYQGIITVYDLAVTDGLPTLWTGNLSMSADILIHPFNNAKGAGLLFLFNEGAGEEGLALFLWNAGNSDSYAVNLVHQDGVSRSDNTLSTVSLGSSIPQDVWFRLTMDLLFTGGGNFTVTGKVFSHSTTSNPNSALGSQVGSTLVYNGSLGVLTDPFQIGLVSRGVSAVVDTSVTNFAANGTLQNGSTNIPEPGLSLLAAGAGLAILARRRRRAGP